jgi:hypothetical protein
MGRCFRTRLLTRSPGQRSRASGVDVSNTAIFETVEASRIAHPHGNLYRTALTGRPATEWLHRPGSFPWRVPHTVRWAAHRNKKSAPDLIVDERGERRPQCSDLAKLGRIEDRLWLIV